MMQSQNVVSYCGFDLITVVRCTKWHYRNYDVRAEYENATLFESSTLVDPLLHRVQFWGDNDEQPTPWHGSFCMNAARTLCQIRFNCKGPKKNLHWVMLYRFSESPDIYRGMDYLGRAVELTFLDSYIWDEVTQCWV